MTAPRRQSPIRAFVDSSAYLALLNPRDRYHEEAALVSRKLAAEHWQLFVTNFIVAEAHALILGRLGHPIARQFLAALLRSSTNVIRPTLADEQKARHIIFQYEDKDFSLTDALSFAVMERLAIPAAFTFDHHFSQYGLQRLSS